VLENTIHFFSFLLNCKIIKKFLKAGPALIYSHFSGACMLATSSMTTKKKNKNKNKNNNNNNNNNNIILHF